MFGSTILEVAIGMIFVYLLMSLLCSAIKEYAEAKWLQYRSKNLWQGIQLLLNGVIDEKKNAPSLDGDSPPDGGDLASELYRHGLVRALYRDNDPKRLPSYIPSRTFALALWNLASQKASELSSSPPDPTQFATTNLKQIKGVINQLPNKQLAESLNTLIDDAEGDFDRAVKNVEDWYDGAMDRVSGWYKRHTHQLLVVIGFVAALLVNADTINIAKSLVQDDALRRSVVATAETFKPPASDGKQSDVEAAKKHIEETRAQLFALGLPLGWAFDQSYKHDPRGVPQWDSQHTWERGDVLNVAGWAFLKLIGLALTAMAISQGAPFWFDLLNKFMVIRSTVKPKEKSPDEASKD